MSRASTPASTTPPRRVLVVHSSDEMYGADLILLRAMMALRRRGGDVTVVLPTDAVGDRPLGPALRAHGCEVLYRDSAVLRRRYFRPAALPGFVRTWLRAVRELRALMRERRPDVVYSNTLAVTAAAFAARAEGIPHMWHVHEILQQPRWLGRALARLARARADTVVAVSEAVAGPLRADAPGIPVRVLHNGIPDPTVGRCRDTDRRDVEAELALPPGVPLVLMVGRLSEWKGGLAFAEVASRLRARGSTAHFAIVGGSVPGETAVEDELRRRAARPPLAGALHLPGERRDVPRWLARATLFVLPSVRPDPYPTVVLEAMYAGLPVVAFAHGGVVEMLDGSGAGEAVPVGDIERMADAVARYLDAPASLHAASEAARARARTEFSPEAFEDALVAILDDVASRRSRGA